MENSEIRSRVLREFSDQELRGVSRGIDSAQFAKVLGVPQRHVEVALKNLVDTGLLSGEYVTGTDVPLVMGITAQGIQVVEREGKSAEVSATVSTPTQPDRKKVFVVHGRNERLRLDLFQFLRAIGLDPIEWSQAVALTGQATPYTGEVVWAALRHAQAILVVLSPDDEARLRTQFIKENDEKYERELTPQPRQNVLFEAGLAFGASPKRTVIVKIGNLRPLSDIHGRNEVRLDNSSERRHDLVERLKVAGCDTEITGNDWIKVGNFAVESEDRDRQPVVASENDTLRDSKHADIERIARYRVEDREITALVAHFLLGLFGVSWSIWWIFDPTRALGWGILTTLIVGALTYGLAHLASWETGWIIRKTKDWFPVVALGSCCFVVASLALQYSILSYPVKTELAFSSHLSDSPFMSLLALGFVLTGGVVLELPAIADARKSKTNLRNICFRWIRLNRRSFVSAIVLAILFGVVFANVATIDSNLVLFTPKVGFVETRYLIDGQFHVYQIGGRAIFGAWSQNQQIVHIMLPPFSLVSESYYSFVTNSTKPPSILSATGLSVSSPTEDSQDRIVVKLTTDSTINTEAQFTVQFYSEFDVKQLAYIYFSPSIFIRNFPNGTQQLQQNFTVVNHSTYDLNFQGIVLYEGGSAPVNVTLNYYPKTYPWPNYYYSNESRTFYLNGSVQKYGNLTAIVTYNSS